MVSHLSEVSSLWFNSWSVSESDVEPPRSFDCFRGENANPLASVAGCAPGGSMLVTVELDDTVTVMASWLVGAMSGVVWTVEGVRGVVVTGVPCTVGVTGAVVTSRGTLAGEARIIG